MNLSILARLGMPVAMGIGAVVAWLSTRKERPDEKPQWRDTSLDDWRKERDAQVEAQREARIKNPEITTGSERENEAVQKHERIGG